MSDPFPLLPDGSRFLEPLGARLGLITRAGTSYTYGVNDQYRRARQQRWRAGLQRSLRRSVVVEAAYLGSATDRLRVTTPLNPMPRQFYITGMDRNLAAENELNRQVPNPFNFANYPSLRTDNPDQYQELAGRAFFRNSTIAKHQLLRAYPHMTGLNQANHSIGKGRYDHVEFSSTLRAGFFRGMASYVWARDTRASTYDNEFDTELMTLPNNSSRPHTVKASGVAEFPFGKGRRFARQGLLSAIVGGWQTAPSFIFQSGESFGFGNVFFAGGDLEAIRIAEPSPERWFAASGFERDRNRQPSAFHVRVFPRGFRLHADPVYHLDLNLVREFRLTEKLKLQARGDFLNALNYVQWSPPSTDPTNSNFGMATAVRNEPRVIQLGLRLSF